MSEWLETCHEAADLLAKGTDTLRTMIGSLSYVHGNSVLVEEMVELAVAMRQMSERLTKATSQKVSEDLKNSEQMSFSLLKASVAGMINSGKLNHEEVVAARSIVEKLEPH